MIRLTVLAIGFAVLPALCYGQPGNLGNWILFFGDKKINNKLNWHHEVQYRNYDAIGDLEQLLIRTGLGYDLGQSANALLGYGFIRSENYLDQTDEKEVINESRIFQQLITRQSVGKLRMQHRYRFEQRFVEDDFRLRFRYFLGLNFPLWNDAGSGHQLYLSAYDEIFLNTEDNAFDRNRLYGGLGYRFNDHLRFELGYMNQFLSSSGRDQLNIVCFFNW